MRAQKESKSVWFIAVAALLVIFSLRCFDSNILLEPDATYIYNRALQIKDCLFHGYYPFLYYNDVGGVGYASPIFYGQLTLFPFLLFTGSISTFIKVYTLVCLLLNFFGFRCFVKRFSSYATLSACFYIVGVPFIFFVSGGLYAAVLATGFSWYFFAFCIDYFRDGKGFYLLILTYFLIWQSNFNSVVLATIVCFALFCLFFRLSRWCDYAKLFVSVLVLVAYNLVNMVVHAEAVRLADFDTLFPGSMSLLRVVLSMEPFGGFLFRAVEYSFLDGDLCCGFMQFGILSVLTYFLVRYFHEESFRFRVCAIFVLVVSVIGYAVGISAIWGTVFKATHVFIQWPIRYFVLLWGFVVAVLSRVVRPNKFAIAVLVLCVLDIFIANPLSAGSLEGGVDELLSTIGHGEYAGEGFVQDVDVWDEYRLEVHSKTGEYYPFVNDYNGLSVDCSVNPGGDVLTLPKLFYKGYLAFGEDGEAFEVSSGYSNYCEVAIGDYQGTLTLRYVVPPLVLFLFWVQVLSAIYYVFCLVRGIVFERRRLV